MSEEEKEFQIAMLETQISCEGHDTFFSLITAVGYSVAMSLYAVSFSNIADFLRLELLIVSTIMILIAIASSFEYRNFHHRSVPQKMQCLRDRFVKSQAKQKYATVEGADKPTREPEKYATVKGADKKTVCERREKLGVQE